MWSVGTSIDPSIFGSFRPEDLILEVGEFCTFSIHGIDNKIYIAHPADREGKVTRYIVAESNQRIVSRAKSGEVTLRSVLDMPHLWFVDVQANKGPIEAFSIHFTDIPDDCLPATEARAKVPDLSPDVALAARAIGDQIGEDNTPSSVVKSIANIVPSSLRRLVDYLGTQPEWVGVSGSAWKRFYNVSAIEILKCSFEIRFGMPKLNQVDGMEAVLDSHASDRILHELTRMMALGLAWCNSEQGSEEKMVALSADERKAILEAMEILSPPQSAEFIEEIQVGGRLAKTQKPISLTKSTRKRVRSKLDSEKPTKDTLVIATGVAEAIDDGLCRMILRQITDYQFIGDRRWPIQTTLLPEITFQYNEDQSESVWSSMRSTVTVIGRYSSSARSLSQPVFRLIQVIPLSDEKSNELQGQAFA